MFDLVIRRDSWLPAVGASAAIAGIVEACFARFATAKAPLSYLLFLISPIIALAIVLAAPSLMTVYVAYILIVIGLPVLVLAAAPLFTAPLWPFVFVWIIAQVAFGVWTETAGIVGGTAYWAHISGFFTGMVLSLLLIKGVGEKAKPREEIPAIG
jgi:membrane associated rhomboid family serine protease